MIITILVIIGALTAGFLTGRSSQNATTVLVTRTDIVTTGAHSNFTTTYFPANFTTCTSINGISCSSSSNDTLSLNIDYQGPWGATYNVYLGLSTSGPELETGSFYGANSTKLTIVLPAAITNGIDTCLVAQKLDGSTSTLAITVPNSDSGNQTSIPFGSTEFCEANIVV